MKHSNKKRAAALITAAILALAFIGCKQPVGAKSDESGTSTHKHKVTFSVDGANGTLKAKVDGAEISSGNKVEQGKTVEFTAEPNTNFAVDKWTNGGSDIPEAGANETYNHTVTANANIKVKFKYAGADLTLDKRSVTKNKGETSRIST